MMPGHGRTIQPNASFFCYGRAENAYILKVERNYYEFLCALDYALEFKGKPCPCWTGRWFELGTHSILSLVLLKDSRWYIGKSNILWLGCLVKMLGGWVGHFSSSGGRFSLIQSSLDSTLIYHMSMYLLPLTNLEKMTKIIRKFFWGETVKREVSLS
jgi:hypothetical protein